MNAIATPAPSTTKGLVTPHGGALVDRYVRGEEAAALQAHAATLPVITLSETQVSDLEMIAVGEESLHQRPLADGNARVGAYPPAHVRLQQGPA